MVIVFYYKGDNGWESQGLLIPLIPTLIILHGGFFRVGMRCELSMRLESVCFTCYRGDWVKLYRYGPPWILLGEGISCPGMILFHIHIPPTTSGGTD